MIHNELLTITSLIILAAAAAAPLIFSTNFAGTSITTTQIAYGQQQNVMMNQTSTGFRSVFDIFVVPGSSHG